MKFSALIAVLFALSLAACGKTETAPAVAADAAVAASAPVAAEAASAPVAAPVAAPAAK